MKKQELLDHFSQKLEIENYSIQTIRNYISALSKFLEYISNHKLKRVTDKEITDYLHYCKSEKQYSFSSMKLVVAAIRYLYKHVLNEPVPEALNIKLRKPALLPTVLTVSEISKILDTVKNLKHKTMLLIIYSGGLRLGELLNLKPGDINSEAMKIHIRQGKGKKDRYVMLSENTLNLLKKYYLEYKPEDYLFEGQNGGQYSPKSVQTVFKRALSKAGIQKKASIHTLRHSFATHLLDDGTDIRYIQELLGHKRLETTRIYTHVSSHSINKIKSPAEKIIL